VPVERRTDGEDERLAQGYGKNAAVEVACPKCHGPVRRLRRTVMDRLISLFSPRRRYQCMRWDCGWEGAIRVDHALDQPESRPR
jgi:hypothetical protein